MKEKHIVVLEDLHRDLSILKIQKDFNSMNDLVKFLFDFFKKYNGGLK